MITLDEARSYVLAACRPLPVEAVPLASAHGLVLAEEVVAGEAIPPFANTAMDGFAVRAADTAGASEDSPVRLAVLGTVAAGASSEVAVGPGQAMRIMTGAPMPPGADAVVMVEATSASDGPGGEVVDVRLEVAPGNHVRPPGDDVRPGDVVFTPGAVLSAAHLGVLASLGRTSVDAIRRPVVGVMSTGDELVEGPGSLRPGQIRDSNRVQLLAVAAGAGWTAVDLGIGRDDEALLEAKLREGLERCDAILTSGGVSMGDFDYVKAVLDRIGDMRWMQVAIKPAKPLAFGTVGRTDGTRVPVFGLPGNPVSSRVSFELFARPGVRRMQGYPDARLDRVRVMATAPDGFRRGVDGKVHFGRVRVERVEGGGFAVFSAGGQGSHQLAALAGATGLAVVHDGDGVPPGGEVEVLLLTD